MLVLKRKPFESVTLRTSDGDVEVIFNGMKSGAASLSFDGPRSVRIVRSELLVDDGPATDVDIQPQRKGAGNATTHA